jgi:TRAP-type C4-dicarboxylate transport system substrate-binding protein
MAEPMTGVRGMTLLLALVLAVGCQADGFEQTRSGAEPVILRLGTPEGASSPYAPLVERFAEQVADDSRGSLRVEVLWEADPDGWSPRTERQLAELVAAGEVDLALVPSRIWDTLGVTTLRALQAPFLIDDHALLGEVTGGELAEELLSGLTEADVVGLALWPEELRRPVSYGAPLLRLADFAGIGIRAPTSETSYAVLRALGAEPTDPEDHGTAVHKGVVSASETAFGWGPLLPQLGTFTANLTLYPKVNVLVIGTDALERLTAEQQERLRQAADDVRELAVRDLPDDREAAAAYCAFGGGVALTTDDAIAELHDAVSPVYSELESDPATAASLDRIRALKDSLPGPAAPEITACVPDTAVADDAPFEVGDPDAPLPEGVLRTEVTEDQLREMGVPENYVAAYRGIYTLAMREGSWSLDGEEDEPGSYDFGGEYTVDGDVLEVSVTEPAHEAFCCEYYRWSVDGDVVVFDALVIEPLDLAWERSGGALFGGHPWTKIAP